MALSASSGAGGEQRGQGAVGQRHDPAPAWGCARAEAARRRRRSATPRPASAARSARRGRRGRRAVAPCGSRTSSVTASARGRKMLFERRARNGQLRLHRRFPLLVPGRVGALRLQPQHKGRVQKLGGEGRALVAGGEQQTRRAEGPVQRLQLPHDGADKGHAGDLVAVFQQDHRRRGVVFVLQQRAQLRVAHLVVARVGQAEEAAPQPQRPGQRPRQFALGGEGPGRTAPSPARASAPPAVPPPDRAKAARRRAPDRCARRRSVPRRWAGRCRWARARRASAKSAGPLSPPRGRRGAFPPRHRRSRPRPAPRARPGRAPRRRRCRP